MTNLLQFTLFGSPAVRYHGQPVTGFRSSKAQALLYYLAVTGRAHTRPTLAGLFWGDQPEVAARTSLSKCLSNLRDLVGEAVLVDRQTIAFNHNRPYQLDTEHFLAGIGQPPTTENIHTWQAALTLYRGDFLEGFYVREAPEFEQWVLVQRAHYREAVVQGLHALANYFDQQGDLSSAISYTRRLLTLEPWREEAHRQLMTRLARSGQRAAALAQFEICRQVLEKELAVEPDAETIALVESIRERKFDKVNGEKPLGENHAASVSTPHPAMPTLPIPPTPLIGRERELMEVGELIRDPQCRLITVIGAGGMGKTRLALAAAAAQGEKFQHGAVFVALAGVSSAQFLPQAILTALGFPLQGALSPQQQVRAVLGKQERLLILDNYEHLLPDIDLLFDLLHYAPDITLLVTSRERLALQAEYLYVLTGLSYPVRSHTAESAHNLTNYAAIQLFLQRVRQTQLRFTLNEEEIGAVIDICRVSEGMPLALELTAALVRERPMAEIADKLAQGPSLEPSRLRGLSERHRSIWCVFEYSWQLLSLEEQYVFCALSVFRGGFQVEAAQAVVNTSPEMLALFVDKSLLRRQRGSTADDRYDIHELLRQFAHQKLNEIKGQETIWSNYRAYFLKLAEAAQWEFHGEQQKMWLERLESEHDNLRAAVSHSLATDAELALQFVAVLFQFWYLHGYFSEGRNWLAQALANSANTPSVTRGVALYGASKFAWIQKDYHQATHLALESLNLFRLLDDRPKISHSLNLLGLIALHQNELSNARSMFEQALLIRRQVGTPFDISTAVGNLALVAMHQSNYSQAKLLLEESLSISRLIKDDISTGNYLTNLGYNELYVENWRASKAYFREAISISLAQGDKETVIWCLEGYAEIGGAASEMKDHRLAAACLFGAAQTFRNNLGMPLPPLDRPFYESSLAALRSQMDVATFAAGWAEGAVMSIEEAVAYALASSPSA